MSDILLVPKQEPSYLMVPVEGVQADLVTKTGTIIYVPLASTTSPGIVQVGDGLLISGSGLLSLDQTEIPIKSISKNGTLIVPDAQKNVNIELSKSDVGLGNVDNTSDLNKPISSAQQAALNAKVDKYQGTENVEKGLIVGDDGYLHLKNISAGIESYKNDVLVLEKTEKLNFSNNFTLNASGRKLSIDFIETDPLFTASPAYGITSEDITDWTGKQDVISDLNTIRSGAAAGATAVQDSNYVHTDNNYTTNEKTKLAGLENYDDTALSGRVSAIEELIPPQASAQNPLGDRAFINSSISTATATYRGDYNVVSDLNLEYDASESAIETALASVISTADNNDYCWVKVPTSTSTPTEIARTDKYKYVDAVGGGYWDYEYTLNNSGFTADQWSAINSGITSTERLDLLHCSGAETLTGKKTINGTSLAFKHSDNGHELTLEADSDLRGVLKMNGTELLRFVGQYGTAVSVALNALTDNAIDLGKHGNRWRDAYIARNLTDGTNSITIADIASKSDLLLKPLTLTTTTMTDEQIATLRAYNCVLTNDLTLGTTSLKAGTILTVPFEYSGSLRGMAIYNNKIMTYYIALSTKQIGDGAQDIVISNVAQIKTAKVDFGNNATITKDSSDRINLNYSNDAKVKVGSAETTIKNRIGADSDDSQDIGRSTVRWRDLYLSGGLRDGNNANYVLKIPTTTSWTSDKTIATTDDLASKQNIVDNTLTTTSKTITGAIDELKSSSDLYNTQIQGLLTTVLRQGIAIDGKVDILVTDPEDSTHLSTIVNGVGEAGIGVIKTGTEVDFDSATFAQFAHDSYILKSVYEAEDSSYKYESSLKLEHGDYTEDSGAPTLTYEIKSNDNLKFQGSITEELSMLYYPMGTQEYPDDYTMFQIMPNAIAMGASYENNLGVLTIAPGAVIVETNGTFTYNEHEVATTNQLPTVNNATITVTQDGTTVGSFTLNQSSNQTINLTGGSDSTDVQVDSVSQVVSGIANLQTINGNYNSSTNKLATANDLSGFVKSHTVITGEDDIYLDIGADADSGGILLVAANDEMSGSPTKQAGHMITPEIVISQVMEDGALGVSQVMSTSGTDMYSTNTVENDEETENILYVTKTAESINLSLSHSVTDTLSDTTTSSQAVIDFTIDQLELDLPLVVPATTNTTDLGSSSYKFKDLYLAGQLKDGTNSISIADIATLSDIPDISGKQNSTDNSLDTASKTVVGAINEVNSIAKQANIAKSFASYSAFITALNSATATAYKVGQSFYIETLNVPDLWIISVENSSSTYTYTTDAAFVTATGASGGQQVGYYKIGQLETQKVDISTKMNKSNPTGTGSLSLNRSSQSTIGDYSVAVGSVTIASGSISFAEGNGTTASGWGSHASGSGTTASGTCSHAEGGGTISQRAYQHTFGQYNVRDTGGTDTTTRGNYVEMVGNGTANNTRSNARTLDWSGNEELAGNIIAKGGKIGDGKNATYKLAIPDTTSWTADKTIATTDQIPTTTSSVTQNSTEALTSGGAYTALALKANDNSVVKLTGDQTVWGNKTFERIFFANNSLYGIYQGDPNTTMYNILSAYDKNWNGTDYSTTILGNGIYKTLIYGSDTRPYYASGSSGSPVELALLSDVPTIPTKTSDLTNDGDGTSNFARLSDLPNLSNYIQQGGTLTAPLTITGGDQSTAGKLHFDTDGRITAGSSNYTIFGRASTGQDVLVGDSHYNLKFRGQAAHPTYNGTSLALTTELPTLLSQLTNDSGFITGGYRTTLTSWSPETPTSWYATWRIDVGNIKIIGGGTPNQEGNKTIHFTMSDATGTSIFTSKVFGVWSVGRYRTSSTANGWQYCYASSLTEGRIVQISDGSYWMAIGI